jgi:hypothetical protein
MEEKAQAGAEAKFDWLLLIAVSIRPPVVPGLVDAEVTPLGLPESTCGRRESAVNGCRAAAASPALNSGALAILVADGLLLLHAPSLRLRASPSAVAALAMFEAFAPLPPPSFVPKFPGVTPVRLLVAAYPVSVPTPTPLLTRSD